MSQLNDTDYEALNRLIETVMARVQQGQCSVAEAKAVVMSFLSSWSDGNLSGFATRIHAVVDRMPEEPRAGSLT